MVFEFLQEASLFQMLPGAGSTLGGVGANPLGALGGAAFGLMFVFFAIAIALYFYMSIAFSKIGAKGGVQNPNLAWLSPPVITVFDVAKAHFWPFPVMVIGMAIGYLLMMGVMLSSVLVILGGLIYSVSMLILVIMAMFVWHYKTWLTIGKNGLHGILGQIIGVVGFAFMLLGVFLMFSSPGFGGIMMVLGIILGFAGLVVYLIMVGIAAWGESGNATQAVTQAPGKMQVRARRA